jgi:hypothetical protein
MNASGSCSWLTEQLARLPLVSYPFDVRALPEDGIYFFYEKSAWRPTPQNRANRHAPRREFQKPNF